MQIVDDLRDLAHGDAAGGAQSDLGTVRERDLGIGVAAAELGVRSSREEEAGNETAGQDTGGYE